MNAINAINAINTGRGTAVQSGTEPLPREFVALADAFATESFAELSCEGEVASKNTVYSPLSLLCALGMLISSSQDDIADRIRLELLRCAGTSDMGADELESGFLALTAHLQTSPHAEVETANSIWLDGEVGTRPSSNSTTRKLAQTFAAEALRVPFGSSEATEAIREWVAQKTRGKLKPSIMTSKDMAAVLINSLYAKLSWEKQFDPADTSWGDFHTGSSRKGDARFMHAWLSSQHCLVTDSLTRLSLKCEGGYRVEFLMPADADGLAGLLSDTDALKSALGADDNRYVDVDLALPRFDVRSDLDLKELVCSLRMGGVFKPQDRNPLVEGALQVSDILQGVAVTQDETGFEGAAYTALTMITGAPEPDDLETISIAFDRPFMFRVLSEEGIPLFIGTVVDPTTAPGARFFSNPENDKLKCGKGNPARRIASIRFSAGGYFGGRHGIEIRRDGTGKISCRTFATRTGDHDDERVRDMEEAEFNRICIKLRDLGVFRWTLEYVEPALDGEQWDLAIEDVDGATFLSCGRNGYPAGYDEVVRLLMGAGLSKEVARCL